MVPRAFRVAFLTVCGTGLLATLMTTCIAGDAPLPLPGEKGLSIEQINPYCRIRGTYIDGKTDLDTNCTNFSFAVVNGYIYLADHNDIYLIPLPAGGNWQFGWEWDDKKAWFRELGPVDNWYWTNVDLAKRRDV